MAAGGDRAPTRPPQGCAPLDPAAGPRGAEPPPARAARGSGGPRRGSWWRPGPATFRVGRGRPASGAGDGRRPGRGRPRVRPRRPDRRRGRRAAPRIEAVALEDRGPVRATVRIEGRFAGPRPGCRFVARLCFFAGTGLVRLRLTLHNPQRARHPGGIWDLGDPGSIFFRDLSLELAPGRRGPAAGRPGRPRPGRRPGRPAGDGWRSTRTPAAATTGTAPTTSTGAGRVPCSFRGYRVRAAGREERGLRASPVVAVRGPAGRRGRGDPRVLAAVPQGAGGRGPDPAGPALPRAVRRPLRAPGRRAEDAHRLARLRPRRRGRRPARWTGSTGRPALARDARVVRRLRGHPPPGARAGRADGPARGAAGRRSSPAPRSFFARREVIDEYGWRNFGEVYADHEAAYYPGPPPVDLALQQPVRPRLRDDAPVPPDRRRPLVRPARPAGPARHRHRHLPHRPGPGRLQRRPVLAHRPLPGRGHLHPPRLLAGAIARRRAALRRRPQRRAQLHHRPAALPLPDRRPGRPRRGARPGRLGHRTWTTAGGTSWA